MSNLDSLKHSTKKSLLRFIIYSIIFTILTYPFFGFSLKGISSGIILGLFMGVLNEIHNKLRYLTGK